MTEIRCAIELRQSQDGPGRLTGTLIRYGDRASDRPERFEAGALRWPDNGVVLRRQHARSNPIMRIIPEVRGSEVIIDTPLPDTASGRDTAAEIRSGLFGGLSCRVPVNRRKLPGGRAQHQQRASHGGRPRG